MNQELTMGSTLPFIERCHPERSEGTLIQYVRLISPPPGVEKRMMQCNDATHGVGDIIVEKTNDIIQTNPTEWVILL